MPLWNVSVGDVSQRYVDAPSKAAAVRIVQKDHLARIELVADPAPASLQRAFDAAGPQGRREILCTMDGLNNPRTIGDMKKELRRLEAWERDTDAWIRKQLLDAPPPPDPRRVRRLLQAAELDFIEKNLARRRHHDAPTSPYHQA